MFSEKYSHGKKFNVDDSKFEFISLDDFVQEFKLDENIKLQQDLYAVRRELNFYKFSAGEWKDLSFPNSEVKEERRYISPEIEEIKNTVSDFWKSIYKSSDSDGSNNY